MPYFLNFCAQTRIAGATNVVQVSARRHIVATDLVKVVLMVTATDDSTLVRNKCAKWPDPWETLSQIQGWHEVTSNIYLKTVAEDRKQSECLDRE
jgi:hypothetical protein